MIINKVTPKIVFLFSLALNRMFPLFQYHRKYQSGSITRTLALTLVILSFSASCGGNLDISQPFLPYATPEEQGMNPELLTELVADVKREKLKNIHSLIVIKDDKIILEEYFNGYRRSDLHYSASVTKSFASVLLGIAIDQGYFNGNIEAVLNRPVRDLFPEYADVIDKDSLKRELKLKHILSMTAGFEWDEHTYPYTDRRNDCNRINNSQDPMRFLFERKLIYQPGEVFYYNGGLSLSISYLIEEYTGMSVVEFAEKYLFKPLGIEKYRWDEVANGLTDTDGGLHLTPLDQAKLGYLFLQNGRWVGQQIVSEEWVVKSTTLTVDNADQPDYGYQWWGGNFYSRDTFYRTFFASGHGGQKVIVFPEHDLILVIAQQVFNNPLGHLNFIAVMANYVVPALSTAPSVKENTISLTAAELQRYTGTYFSEDRTEFVEVTSDGNSLTLTGSNGDSNDFYPLGDHSFKTRVLDLLDIKVTFVTDERGTVSALQSKFWYKNLQFYKNMPGHTG